MNRRFRSFAAMVALLSLSAYYAESLWASMCPPGGEMEVGMELAIDGDVAHHLSATGGELPDAHPESAPAQDLPCPLTFAGTGTCVSVTVPADIRLLEPPAGLAELRANAAESLNGFLLDSSLYRPPRP